MKDQRTSYGTKDECSLVQQVYVLDMNRHTFEPIHLALVGLMAGWQTNVARYLKFPIG